MDTVDQVQVKDGVDQDTVDAVQTVGGKYKYGFGQLTIRRDGDQLFAKMTGQPEHKLFAESETKLFWRVVNAQLEFELDDDGKVSSATHYQAGQKIAVKKIE